MKNTPLIYTILLFILSLNILGKSAQAKPSAVVKFSVKCMG